MPAIDGKHLTTNVPAIFDIHTGGDESVDKTPTAQRPRRQILTRMVSTRARRDTQKHHRWPNIGNRVHGRQCATRLCYCFR